MQFSCKFESFQLTTTEVGFDRYEARNKQLIISQPLNIILQRHFANGQFIEKQQLLKIYGCEYEERDNFKIKFQ